VTKSMRVIPTRVSSSTTCTTSLRPTGSISFGCDLVAAGAVCETGNRITAMSMAVSRGDAGFCRNYRRLPDSRQTRRLLVLTHLAVQP
jgi:hypothetical protein